MSDSDDYEYEYDESDQEAIDDSGDEEQSFEDTDSEYDSSGSDDGGEVALENICHNAKSASEIQPPSAHAIDAGASAAGSSDEDDSRLFASCGDPDLPREILRVKRDDPGVRRLSVCSTHGRRVELNEAASARFGAILGRNTKLKMLSIASRAVGGGGFIIHEAPANIIDVRAVCAGLRHNRIIQHIELEGIDLHNAENMSTLAPFLRHNPSLREIYLQNCQIGPTSFNYLTDALQNRAGNNLELLVLDKNPIGDSELDGLLRASGGGALRSLSLEHCQIGRRGCTSLTKSLGDEESGLTHLYLRNNAIDHESAITLARSLANNKTLELLLLDRNAVIEIEEEFWSVILGLVCNTSSIGDIVASNHVLSYLTLARSDAVRALGEDDGNLLHASLKLNSFRRRHGENFVTRQKVIWAHARGDVDIAGVFSDEIRAMPRVLAWFGDNSIVPNTVPTDEAPWHPSAKISKLSLDAVYRIVRSNPDICNSERECVD